MNWRDRVRAYGDGFFIVVGLCVAYHLIITEAEEYRQGPSTVENYR